MSTNPYLAGLHLLKQHPGTSSQKCLAKCILSLYNPNHAFSISEILAPLESRYAKAVLDMVHAYADGGATEELNHAGECMWWPTFRTWLNCRMPCRKRVLLSVASRSVGHRVAAYLGTTLPAIICHQTTSGQLRPSSD